MMSIKIKDRKMIWEKVKLDDVCDIYGGTTPSTSNTSYWDGNIVWLSPTDLPEIGEITIINNSTRKITDTAIKESSLVVLPKGSVIYSTRASIGKIGIAEIPLTTNQGFVNFICKGNLFNKFLCYTLKYYTPQIEKLSNSTTFAEVSRTSIRNFKIPLPPLPIQQKIAAILDQADALRKKDQQLLAKYDELLQVVFYDMFGDPVRNEKGWEVKKLGSLTKRIVVGHVGPTSHGYVEKGIPFLRTQNVRENSINYEDMNYISEDFHKKLSKSKINFGDILISRVGVNRGMAAIVPKDLNQANCANVVIVGKSELFNSLFISFVLNNTFGRGAAFGYSVGSAQGVVNTQIVKVWPIIYPTVELQNQFSTIAQNIQQQRKQVKQQLQQSEALFQSLLQRAFKGDLVKE